MNTSVWFTVVFVLFDRTQVVLCRIRAGCTALPPLLNIKQVMQQRQCSGVWSAKDELPVSVLCLIVSAKQLRQLIQESKYRCPDSNTRDVSASFCQVEIDLGQECRYHSIFACPILRQQSTDSNPPVRLVCGHVISRDALNKLANGNK